MNTATATVTVTRRPSAKTVTVTRKLLEAGVIYAGAKMVHEGKLTDDNAGDWIAVMFADFQKALDGKPVARALAEMVAAAIRTAGGVCTVA